jgi:hypothetical protein
MYRKIWKYISIGEFDVGRGGSLVLLPEFFPALGSSHSPLYLSQASITTSPSSPKTPTQTNWCHVSALPLNSSSPPPKVSKFGLAAAGMQACIRQGHPQSIFPDRKGIEGSDMIWYDSIFCVQVSVIGFLGEWNETDVSDTGCGVTWICAWGFGINVIFIDRDGGREIG